MRLLFSVAFLSIILTSCSFDSDTQIAKKDKALTNYVNPFIGTGGHGHTYPGATMPFGMMQLSPDTRLDGWDGCSGYHYTDTEIYGFSHTHLSGTGVSDYGDVLVMPTNKVVFNNGADGKEGYKSKFRHDREIAEPGFYKVHLDATNIDVELTVSERSGMHRYTFEAGSRQVVILDLEHRDEVLDSKLNVNSKRAVSGYRHSKAWAKDQRLFFAIKTSHPFKKILESSLNKELPNVRKAALTFINPNNEPVIIKIGISAVDLEGAKRNLNQEIGNKTFETVKREAENTWKQQLEKIVIEDDNTNNKINFYTSMYHSMIAPNLYQDVDGRYRGMDLKIHHTKDFEYYTVFSLWDTYRATHPLYTIIEQDKTNDFINTFLAKYDEGGIMPIWDLAGNYTGCMIGYHAVPVISDAYLKGINNYDAQKALSAMKHSANQNKLGLESYKKFGFIPVENESESVSKTLEYAYDDWAIAKMADTLNKPEDARIFYQRAQNYKNVFDPETQFMRGRFRNTWFTPFDPYEVNFNYTEANSWQYSFYVPQDISGFTNLMGGKVKLEQKLDDLFNAKDETSGAHQVDITGLIGQYAHGNEPSHHMAYLYNFVNKPHKTQEKINAILTQLYHNSPDGISGNEDCGQMSAWYIFSSLGFYPVTPGDNTYIIGSPLFKTATIHLENGKNFTIKAYNLSKTNFYIKSAKLNSKNLTHSFITHEDLMNGGLLEFEMSDKPSQWATQIGSAPKTEITEHLIVSAPFIASGDIAFSDKTQIKLASNTKNATLFYAVNDSEFKAYETPININKAISLKVYAELQGTKSAVIETHFFKINPHLKLDLNTTFADRYSGGGKNALVDGVVGAKDFRTGTWQGYHNKNVEAIISLGANKKLKSAAINFLEDQRSWIFLPTKVSFYGSNDGHNYNLINTINFGKTSPNEDVIIKTAKSKLSSKTYSHIKIVAINLGDIPNWHLGAKHGGKSWIFTDEIIISP